MPIRREKENKTEYLPSHKAITANIEVDKYELDKDLKNLQKVMIKINDVNLEEAFWNDSIATSFTDITAHVIIGDGLRIRLDKNEKAKKVIEEWNRRINVKRQTVESFLRDSWFDAIIHKHFMWRVDDRTPEYDNVDVQRLDPKSIEIREDPVMGYRKFIQHVSNYKYYRTKKQFYRQAGKDNEHDWVKWNSKAINYGNNFRRTSNFANKIHIPDELNNVLYGDFFEKPPIANAMHYIVYKRWILWFMRKYSQKHWAPFIIIKIGDPKTSTYPTSPQEMQKAIDNASLFVKQITSFGGAAVPGDYTFETLEKQTSRSSEIYVTYIKELDKQIMYTIFGSMGQRDASGNELATGRILEKGWLRFIAGIRRQYELLLTDFYANVLLPYHGINNIEPTDIDIEWSNLIFEETLNLMKAIEVGVNSHIFKDINEARKAAQTSFPFLNALTDGLNKNYEELRKDEIKQSSSMQNQESARERLVAYNQQRKDK